MAAVSSKLSVGSLVQVVGKRKTELKDEVQVALPSNQSYKIFQETQKKMGYKVDSIGDQYGFSEKQKEKYLSDHQLTTLPKGLEESRLNLSNAKKAYEVAVQGEKGDIATAKQKCGLQMLGVALTITAIVKFSMLAVAATALIFTIGYILLVVGAAGALAYLAIDKTDSNPFFELIGVGHVHRAEQNVSNCKKNFEKAMGAIDRKLQFFTQAKGTKKDVPRIVVRNHKVQTEMTTHALMLKTIKATMQDDLKTLKANKVHAADQSKADADIQALDRAIKEFDSASSYFKSKIIQVIKMEG